MYFALHTFILNLYLQFLWSIIFFPNHNYLFFHSTDNLLISVIASKPIFTLIFQAIVNK
jgi:hypothetical protein